MAKPNRFVFSLGFNLSTALRATEAFHSGHERIFDAGFEYQMLPGIWRGLMLLGIGHAISSVLARLDMGTPGMLLCRTRFIDDALAAALFKGVEQVVSLGAGFDTRAYRIPGIEQARFFELDLPTAQSLKR